MLSRCSLIEADFAVHSHHIPGNLKFLLSCEPTFHELFLKSID